jgi:endonuclease YncB( thermonuclease family)
MDNPEGKKAADFVRFRITGSDELSKTRRTVLGAKATSKQADQIVLTSSKSDKYDRYLADVFLPARSLKASAGGTGATGPKYYTDKDGKNVYLNNAILESGLAVRMGE